jgi:glucose-6-phosphate-specific signal transduction histidine kinase
MKPPRFRLSTLCLIIALVALVLGYAWQSIENNRLPAELKQSQAHARRYLAGSEEARQKLVAAYAQSDQLVRRVKADAARLEALEESTKRALDELGIEPRVEH